MAKVTIPFGSGIDRYTGIAAVGVGSMADMRNVRPLRGKLQVRRGSLLQSTLPDQGGNPCTSVTLIHSVQSQQEGVAVGYYGASRQVHVYRIGATGVDPIHMGLWFTLDAAAATPPVFTAAESYGKAFIAHDEVRQGRRATTQVYDAIAGTLTNLTADLEGTGAAAVKFRGVTTWRNYLVGWGFGNASDTRPEIVRISKPGEPAVFLPEHYFIAGDQGSAVTAVRPAASGLIACKPSGSFEIVGTSELNFGILPLYTLLGALAANLAITVEGTCYVWGIRGPWATTIGDKGDLAPPLDLEGPPPSDLPSMSEARRGFAVYVPTERTIEWHFGSRIFALTLDDQEGGKWSYRERAFAAASGGLLYSGGETLADSPDVAPTGHPEIASITATGTTATVEWDNVLQDGDETLELWLKPDGGAWAQVPPDSNVTLAASQTRDATVAIGLDHTAAVRYRRGGQYGAGYESENPDDWPASARATFHSTPVAPTLDTVVWARASASVERARVSFTPAAGHEGLQHIVRRDGAAIETLAAGVTQFDDTGLTGETTESYTVRAVAYGHESVDSNQISVWAGPIPAPSNVEYSGPPGGEYTISWDSGRLDLATQVLIDGVVQVTAAVGAESAGFFATPPFVVSVRHMETKFGVTDYGEATTGSEV